MSPLPYGMNLSFNVGDREDNVRANREAFFREAAVDPARVAVPGQVHSAVVLRATQPGPHPRCDGLVTDERDLYLSVTVADCVPLFIADPKRKAVAAIHSGWRGTAAGIAGVAVRLMASEFDSTPEDLVAFIGPAVSVCCYVVGEEVASLFDPRFVLPGSDGRKFLDMKGAIESQLTEAGLVAGNVEVSPHCTITDSRLFHSYRRDREKSGRMMGLIGLV